MGIIKRIHINQHKIRANKSKPYEPVISCKTSKENIYGNKVEILDDDGNIVAEVIYRPDKPLSCGAKVWIETKNKIIVSNNKDEEFRIIE
jgi:hypothetical protein|tara:strand:+ start:768 stop:1037 length:270 start_codon:yes stop_codon:yes gene_type:complete